MVISKAYVRQCEFRIERECLLQALTASPGSLRSELPLVRPVSKIRLVCRQAWHSALGRRSKLQFQRSRNRRGDVVLDSEDVRHLAVVTLRPPVRTVSGVNKLRRHTETATGAAYAALEHERHSECFGDPADVLVLPLERECGRAGNHLEAAHLRQGVDDLFRETVAEVLVVDVSAQIGKRQHGDRRRRVGAPAGQVLQGVPDVGHRLEPAVGILGEAAPHDLLQHSRRFEWTRVVAQHGAEDLRRGVAGEGASARKQLIQHGAEAEHVRSRVERLGGRLFGGHVRRCPNHFAGCRPRCVEVIAGEPRDTEVEQLGVRRSTLPNDHDIGGLQIAVKNAAFVRGVQCVGNLARQTHRFVSVTGPRSGSPWRYSRTR